MRRALSTALLATAAGLAWAGSAGAQDIAKLITTSPANQSADPQVSRLIEQLIAERSTSAAVRARAERAPGAAGLQVGADEILADIGATGALGQRPAQTSAPMPATTAATPVAAPARLTPPPEVKAAATAPAQPAPAATSSALPGWWPFKAPDVHTGVGTAGGGGHGGGGGGGGGNGGGGGGGW